MQLQYTRKVHPAAYLFGGVFLIYLALSPGSVANMGYASEELTAGSQILSNAVAWMRGNSPTPISWPRHGLLTVLFDLPFVGLGSHLKGHLNQDWVVSFEPILLTGLMVMVLFLWLRRLTSPGWSYLLALTAAFCTMLWPYAYIGLEVKQSLALILAGYLGFSHEAKITWPRGLLFAASCAVAVSVKASGTFLIPAVLFLVGYFYWRDSFQELREELPKLLATLAIIFGVFLSNYALRSLFFARYGSQGHFFRYWLIDGPTEYLLQVVGYFGSPNKGLIVYAPILLLSFLAFPRVLKEHRPLAIFTLLTLGGLASGHALQRFYVDETWGARYLHSAIAPLIICIGATRERLHASTAAPVLVLAALGFWVSFLGAFFWYGVTHQAATDASQATLETLQGDIVWNPILLDERLFFYYLRGGPEWWMPNHIWWFAKPPNAPAERPVNLSQYAVPQSFLIHFWRTPFHGGLRRLWYFYFLCLPVGVLLLAKAGWETRTQAHQLVDGRQTKAAETVMPEGVLRS